MTETAEVELTKEQKINKSYTIASGQLRDKYRAEFNELRVAAAKDLGVDWSPEPTAAEKALDEIAGLLNKHPDIASDVIGLVEGQAQAQIAGLTGLTSKSEVDPEPDEEPLDDEPEPESEIPLEFKTD